MNVNVDESQKIMKISQRTLKDNVGIIISGIVIALNKLTLWKTKDRSKKDNNCWIVGMLLNFFQHFS